MTRYEQENDSVYMVIDSDDNVAGADYEMKMLEKNNIKSLLPVNVRCVDNHYSYYYNVTAKQQFSKIYEYQKLSRKNVENVLKSLETLVNEVNEYMLNLNRVILKVECIYVDMSKDRLLFAYGADEELEEQDEFRQGVKRLFDYIIEHFDHSGADADIMYVYNVYQKIAQGEYNASDFKGLVDVDSAARDSIACDFGSVHENNDKSDNVLEFIPEQIIEDEEEVENRTAYVAVIILKSIVGFMIVVAAGRMFAPSYVPVPVSDVAAFIIMLAGACIFVILNKIPLNMFTTIKNKKESQPYMYSDDDVEASNIQDAASESEKDNDSSECGATILLSDYIKGKMNSTVCLRFKEGSDTAAKVSYNDIAIKKVPWVIGSMEKHCDTVIDSRLVSHIHACVTKVDGEYFIEDMNSTNGTYVNGERLIMNSRKQLSNGDIVTIATISYEVEMS